jgi:hypothetical protein
MFEQAFQNIDNVAKSQEPRLTTRFPTVFYDKPHGPWLNLFRILSITINHPAITRGPMLRYVFLSVFALLLLIACGGNDVNLLTKTGIALNVIYPGPT